MQLWQTGNRIDMTSREIYELMDNPSSLSADTLSGLKQVVDDFPYFHTARMLYLKNLALVDDIRFASALKKMSVYVSDRRKLFTLIEGHKYGILSDEVQNVKSSFPDSFSLIDEFLLSKKESEGFKAETSLLLQPSVSSDYIFWTLSEKTSASKPDNGSAVKLQHHELIDDFIRNDEQRTPGTGFVSAAGGDELDYVTTTEAHDDREGGSFFTETLARIYIKQKRYEKALQIIKNLSLKYPEKNVYFADQIRFLEKLIINTKK